PPTSKRQALAVPLPPPEPIDEAMPPDAAAPRGRHSTRRSQVVKKQPVHPALLATVVVLGVAGIGAGMGMLRGRSLPRPAATPSATCEGSAKCTLGLGAPAVCGHEGRCVPLASEDCQVVADPGDLSNDTTVWVGTMFPLTGPDAK